MYGKADKLLVQNRLQVQRLLQLLVRLRNYILDLVKHVNVVDGSGRVCEIKGLLDAQILPLLRIILRTAHVPALVNVQAGARPHGNRQIVVAARGRGGEATITGRHRGKAYGLQLTQSGCSNAGSALTAPPVCACSPT